MRNWYKLTPTEKCDYKKYLESPEYGEKTEVYDAGKATTFALSGIKSANDWKDGLLSDVNETSIKKWIDSENNC